MYIGHYAFGLALASMYSKRGVAIFLAGAAALPDLAGVGLEVLGLDIYTHGIFGFAA